jgi:hypothetical protein
MVTRSQANESKNAYITMFDTSQEHLGGEDNMDSTLRDKVAELERERHRIDEELELSKSELGKKSREVMLLERRVSVLTKQRNDLYHYKEQNTALKLDLEHANRKASEVTEQVRRMIKARDIQVAQFARNEKQILKRLEESREICKALRRAYDDVYGHMEQHNGCAGLTDGDSGGEFDGDNSNESLVNINNKYEISKYKYKNVGNDGNNREYRKTKNITIVGDGLAKGLGVKIAREVEATVYCTSKPGASMQNLYRDIIQGIDKLNKGDDLIVIMGNDEKWANRKRGTSVIKSIIEKAKMREITLHFTTVRYKEYKRCKYNSDYIDNMNKSIYKYNCNVFNEAKLNDRVKLIEINTSSKCPISKLITYNIKYPKHGYNTIREMPNISESNVRSNALRASDSCLRVSFSNSILPKEQKENIPSTSASCLLAPTHKRSGRTFLGRTVALS